MPSADSGPSIILPATLSHFVIFNPTLRPDIPKSDNKDDDDDLREAGQILFYTSREAGGVSRDRMLRQVGLAKGLMGFADMLSDSLSKYWAIHANRSRLIVFTPEPDFFIYICVTPSHADNEKKDPAMGSQGVSDEMLVDGLARGYEDFRLLHGPLSSQLPVSNSLSSTLDKFFTRFAFQFESTHLNTPSITQWVDGYPPPSISSGLFDEFANCLGAEDSLIVVGQEGPLYVDQSVKDQPLIRYLYNLVQATLPTPVVNQAISIIKEDRQTLGFGLNHLGLGRKSQTSRKASWATLGGWVPEIRRSSTPSIKTEPDRVEPPLDIARDDSKGKWGFGLGGLADAMGNVGTAFGLGRPATPIQGQDKVTHTASNLKIDSNEIPPSQSSLTDTEPLSPESHHVEQSAIAVSELEAAVELDEEIDWDARSLWIHGENGEIAKRRICWVIRDNIIIAVVFPSKATMPYNTPSTKQTLNLFAKISQGLSQGLSPSEPPVSTNPCIVSLSQDVIVKAGIMDTSSEQSIVSLKSILRNDSAVNEIFAKTSLSQFLVAKRNEDKELYMNIGSKDVSLTDADHVVRTFVKQNPGLAV
ncbi:uncharacterized protein IL334_003602 [Kwoniella shivajii]|uniref:CCZ1/INTU/HSP4 first Longin domain-containing protein n=1 Tax=Kwoniella shivajii TaxID=564305 RepID=A0ABZ1CYK1_9TREE|nr:hypothetical protein IL334_003602 [Kwoniella shivajii]